MWFALYNSSLEVENILRIGLECVWLALEATTSGTYTTNHYATNHTM